MRAPALPALLLLALVASMTAAVACSNQGEGEVCDQNNGSNDCQDGLVCESAPGITGATGLVNVFRCCPPSTTLATTAACSSPSATVIDAATEAPDGSNLTTTPVAEAGGASEAGAADGAADVVSIDSAGDVVATPEASIDGGADASPE
jgi:hypothetical protein